MSALMQYQCGRCGHLWETEGSPARTLCPACEVERRIKETHPDAITGPRYLPTVEAIRIVRLYVTERELGIIADWCERCSRVADPALRRAVAIEIAARLIIRKLKAAL